MQQNLSASLATVDGSSSDQELADLVERLSRQLEQEGTIDFAEVQREYPQHAARLETLLPSMLALVNWRDQPSSSHDGNVRVREEEPGRTLGDFRLIREMGHGGMGTVFEAEQLSMGRRVALKVLPFAALIHEKSLQRFRNEVRAAAALDHPNIVSVYSVGEDRGVHFYAMQLIRGQTLADVIVGLRATTKRELPASPAGRENADVPMIDSTSPPAAETEGLAHAHISTALDTRTAAERFRSVAWMGIQAAEALQHAHDQGVLHRDVKPSNLMLDREGQLYVTDFGLARIEADAGITMTGDVVGTLRYMAPEQALAKRGTIDHRADIYSLGATLYELLALEPAFSETDRSELLRQIAVNDPRPLRHLVRQVPTELATIVSKAMAKAPSERYESTQALADDLRAFLEHRPIKARQPTLFNRAVKWSRRHRSFVAASTITLLISALAVAASVGWALRDVQVRKEAVEEKLLLAIAEIEREYARDRVHEANSAVAQAASLIAVGEVEPSIERKVRAWQADLAMVQRLESVRLTKSTMVDRDLWSLSATPRAYQAEFAGYGIGLHGDQRAHFVETIRHSPIRRHLVAAIDDWAAVSEPNERSMLLKLTRAIDVDAWQNELRQAIEDDDIEKVKKLAADEWRLARSRTTIATVTTLLVKRGQVRFAEGVLRGMHRRFPSDFWINYTLGTLQSVTPAEALGYMMVACSQRPGLGPVRNALGNAYFGMKDFERAEDEFREAVRLQPDEQWHHKNVVQALYMQERMDKAEAEARSSLQLFPGSVLLQCWLAKTLRSQGKISNGDFAAILNELAWEQATSTGEIDVNGHNAVSMALEACKRTDFKIVTYVDTLSAAFAAAGDFESAIFWSEKALLDSPKNPKFLAHNERFKQYQPWRGDP